MLGWGARVKWGYDELNNAVANGATKTDGTARA